MIFLQSPQVRCNPHCTSSRDNTTSENLPINCIDLCLRECPTCVAFHHSLKSQQKYCYRAYPKNKYLVKYLYFFRFSFLVFLILHIFKPIKKIVRLIIRTLITTLWYSDNDLLTDCNVDIFYVQYSNLFIGNAVSALLFAFFLNK